MKIHLLRHAKTDQLSKTGLDIDRELLPKGISQAKKMSEYLKDYGKLDVHCSSSKRTRQTFEIIFEHKPIESIHFTQELYLAEASELLVYVNGLKTTNDLIIIGHNNGISDFASYISDESIQFKTCAYACFEANIDSWAELSKGNASLLTSYRPEVD